MNNTKKYLISFLSGLILIPASAFVVTSQTSNNSKTQVNSTNTNTTSDSTVVAQRRLPTQTRNTDETTVMVYHVDNQCEGLVSEQVKVPKSNSLEAAVGKVLEEQNNGDFEIVGYRVKIDQNQKIATIDFRLPPDTQRQFISLSPCELFSIFGSLRETLTTNSEWNIKEVQFTEKGKEIFL